MKAGRAALLLAIPCFFLLGSNCRLPRPGDPLLHRDWLTYNLFVAELVPFAPWIEPGPDRRLGSDDDVVHPDVVGDVDLVVRTGAAAIGGTIPPPRAAGPAGAIPSGVAEPFGQGVPIAFAVLPSDGIGPEPWGALGVPPYWQGLPVLVVAFADLDDDGYVGVTLLDGDPLDEATEEAEWEPVGRRFALGAGAAASGTLAIEVGGPPGRPVRVALTAAAWAGVPEPGFLGGHVPRGPAVMTRLPFLPELRPDRVLEGGDQGPPPAQPDALVGVEIRAAIAPDPAELEIGEAFTLRLDGSDPTIDVAHVVAGAPVRFGLARRPDPATYRALPERPLRPGVDAQGPLEVLHRLVLADDGAASLASARVLALDRLDNPTAPSTPQSVTVTTGGGVRIVAPDADADPFHETVLVAGAAGVELTLDDAGGAFDAADDDQLVVAGADALTRVPVLLPDPDVDDSGLVDQDDLDAIDDARGARLGDPDFDPALDLDGSGRVDRDDVDLAEPWLGTSIAVP